MIDQARQRRGFGRATVEALTRRLLESEGCDSCALSYAPGNAAARGLYLSLGFVETGEMRTTSRAPLALLAPERGVLPSSPFSGILLSPLRT